MTQVQYVEVSFRVAGQAFLFDINNLTLQRGEEVVCETEHGLALGSVIDVCQPETRPPSNFKPLKVIRHANDADRKRYKENKRRAKEAFHYCQELVEKHKLPMKLIDADYSLNTNKLLFYFSAEGRIDFRQLVRDLARYFQLRIEMRQIGVRDTAKFIGGLGPCGQELCCSRFLRRFTAVSVRMAKDQNLSLNSQKITGVCGRLMCCLSYEQSLYQSAKKVLPHVGETVSTPQGKGLVRHVQPITQKVTVVFTEQSNTKEEEFDIRDLKGYRSYAKKWERFEKEERVSLEEENLKKGRKCVEPFMEARRAASKTLRHGAPSDDEIEEMQLRELEREEKRQIEREKKARASFVPIQVKEQQEKNETSSEEKDESRKQSQNKKGKKPFSKNKSKHRSKPNQKRTSRPKKKGPATGPTAQGEQKATETQNPVKSKEVTQQTNTTSPKTNNAKPEKKAPQKGENQETKQNQKKKYNKKKKPRKKHKKSNQSQKKPDSASSEKPSNSKPKGPTTSNKSETSNKSDKANKSDTSKKSDQTDT